jgi:hypothetical protein
VYRQGIHSIDITSKVAGINWFRLLRCCCGAGVAWRRTSPHNFNDSFHPIFIMSWRETTMPSIFVGEVIDGVWLGEFLGVEGLDNRG